MKKGIAFFLLLMNLTACTRNEPASGPASSLPEISNALSEISNPAPSEAAFSIPDSLVNVGDGTVFMLIDHGSKTYIVLENTSKLQEQLNEVLSQNDYRVQNVGLPDNETPYLEMRAILPSGKNEVYLLGPSFLMINLHNHPLLYEDALSLVQIIQQHKSDQTFVQALYDTKAEDIDKIVYLSPDRTSDSIKSPEEIAALLSTLQNASVLPETLTSTWQSADPNTDVCLEVYLKNGGSFGVRVNAKYLLFSQPSNETELIYTLATPDVLLEGLSPKV